MPEIEDFITYITKRNKKLKGRTISRIFDGLLNYKLADFLLKKAKINKDKYWEELTNQEKNNLNKVVTKLKLNIINTNSFDKAQTCSGGIPLSEINPRTMESTKQKNLYFAGEILDVNGDCGGYNLTFAAISGILAGRENND